MSNPRGQRVVAVDSQALIWGVREEGTEDQLRKARYLFAQLDEDEAQVIIPSIALAEFITPIIDEDETTNTIAAISKRFTVMPFDVNDAVLAAKLWRIGKPEREMGVHSARICLRADCLIIATAKGHGASEFYTDDQDCLNLASKIMTAKKLPDVGTNLFQD